MTEPPARTEPQAIAEPPANGQVIHISPPDLYERIHAAEWLADSAALNARIKMDGLALLRAIPAECTPLVIFDPQYRGVLDKLKYGNEGKGRLKGRAALQQMDSAKILEFIAGIERALIPSGHLLLWMDKFQLINDAALWMMDSPLQIVDLIVWDKNRIGLGYRSRRRSEFLICAQKPPIRAKGIWQDRAIPDIWQETADRKRGPHAKPIGLQTALIKCLTARPTDLVIDPAAGSFTTLEACRLAARQFLGCDIEG